MKEHLKALHIRFLPDQAQEDNLSSREFIKKAEFVNVKSLLTGKDEESETGEDDGTNTNQGGGSQQGGGGNNDDLGDGD